MSLAQSNEEIAQIRDELDKAGKRLVFTNGCFDLLHVGHVRYLQEARNLGDALVVALNSDSSVRSLKGADRPLNGEADRAEVLLGLSSVDFVCVFDGERCDESISVIRPHIYAKGGDYTPETLHPIEKAAIDSSGAEIAILGLVPGKSTSATVAKMGGGKSGRRIGVLGSGYGSNLEAIFKAIDEGELDAEVSLVISDVEDARILNLARGRGIDAVFVAPHATRGGLDAASQKEIRDRLVAAGVDFVVLAGFMRVVKSPLLDSFEGRMINIHPSLLPKHPGLNAWEKAIAAGDQEAGCSIHYVSSAVDGGAIIRQESVPVMENDTPDSLHGRIQEVEHRVYPAAIGDLLDRLAE